MLCLCFVCLRLHLVFVCIPFVALPLPGHTFSEFLASVCPLMLFCIFTLPSSVPDLGNPHYCDSFDVNVCMQNYKVNWLLSQSCWKLQDRLHHHRRHQRHHQLPPDYGPRRPCCPLYPMSKKQVTGTKLACDLLLLQEAAHFVI